MDGGGYADMMGDAVIVRNTGEAVFRDRFAGKEYVISPGKMRAVPAGAAKLWLGDWELEGRARSEDVERARFRRGGVLPKLEVVDEPEEDDNEIDDPTDEEEALLKKLRRGSRYVFPDGTQISKKVEALTYLRGLKRAES